MKTSASVAALAALLVSASTTMGFYIPGVAPRNYLPGEAVELKVNKLTSVKAQLPFSYYSLPVCKPDKIIDVAENLGEVLSGDVIENSAFVIQMNVPKPCTVLCTKIYDQKDRAMFRDRIANRYTVHWIV